MLMALFSIAVLVQSKKAYETVKIKFDSYSNMEVQEPSDIVLNEKGNGFYVASDNGYIAEVDLKGKLIRKSHYFGIDHEGITLKDNYLYIVDETTRRFHKWNLQFESVQIFKTDYHGGRNKGFESITWNPVKQRFVCVTEKDPVLIMEFDTNFQVLNEIDFSKFARDISAATFYDNSIWLLSDEDRTLFRCNANNYAIEKAFKLPLINPEGIAFDNEGNLFVCSDDRERLYTFSKNHFVR
jgi:uncharacterized protein YjiK